MVMMAVFNISQAEDLQAVDQTEFLKLITEERYVVALFCPSSAMERCKEFEGELSSIREDLIEVLDGDGWLVKMVDSPMVQEYAVGKTDQPVIIMFRSGLPVIYDGLSELASNISTGISVQVQPMMRRCWTPWSGTRSLGCRS